MLNALLHFKYFDYINEASVFCAITAFFVIVVKGIIKKERQTLETVLGKSISASAIPTGLALLICAFKPDLLKSMSDLNIHIATAGCALLFISTKGIFSKPEDFLPNISGSPQKQTQTVESK